MRESFEYRGRAYAQPGNDEVTVRKQIFTVIEFWPYEPSNYVHAPTWLVVNAHGTEYAIDAGDLDALRGPLLGLRPAPREERLPLRSGGRMSDEQRITDLENDVRDLGDEAHPHDRGSDRGPDQPARSSHRRVGEGGSMNDRDRAYRRAQRKRIIDNRVNFLRETKQQHILEVCDPGRMDDRHPMDCGGSCFMCHGDKMLNKGAKRQQGKREWQAIAEAGYGA